MHSFTQKVIVLAARNTGCTIKRFFHRQKLTNASVQKKRTELFNNEVKRQAAHIVNVEKVEVAYEDEQDSCTLIMNKFQSTPYNCAQHLSQVIVDRSVLAEVNGKAWDMHRPLEENCTLRFLHFKQDDPFYVNRAFWRSASIMLGAVLETAFKDEIYVELCSFPSPNVRSGSFVYDVNMNMPSWDPRAEELRTLSGEMVKLSLASLPFERLVVDAKIALEMFSDNQYKKLQVPAVAASSDSGNSVVLYRLGNFIDMSRGPLISNSCHMGKVSIVSVHPLEVKDHQLLRFQGLALPKGFLLNHFSYGILQKRAQELNTGRSPTIIYHMPEKTNTMSSELWYKKIFPSSG